MKPSEILENLKDLTLDYSAGKRKTAETVMELHRRIEDNLVYEMDANEPLRDFITQVYVSLDNLLNPDFPPSTAELNYFSECFNGKREFILAEVREFEIISRRQPVAKEQDSDTKPRLRTPRNNRPTSERAVPAKRVQKSKPINKAVSKKSIKHQIH
jgi:hypothetical protein